MSGRLASFRGPSTPTSSPVQVRQTSSPSSPSKYNVNETTYHRKLRTALQDLRSLSRIWDELIRLDGQKAATNLIDTRTDLHDTLHLLPSGSLPHSHIVGPRLAIMERHIEELNNVKLKLRKTFQKMNTVVDGLEEMLYEAYKTKGWLWVHDEPLWCTWTLEKFVSSIPNLLPPYHKTLNYLEEIVAELRCHSTPFEMSKKLLVQWAEQPYLDEGGWSSTWEDLCSVEVDKWSTR